MIYVHYTGTCLILALCSRVDAVYGDTLKIASGLGHTAKQNDEMRDENSADNDDDNNQAREHCNFSHDIRHRTV